MLAALWTQGSVNNIETIQELKKDTEIIKGQVDELKKGEGEEP